jgi:hypothetical protein
MKRPSIWKLVGLAGLAGVAATGVVVARAERERRSYTPEDVRARLQDRLAQVDAARAATNGSGPAQVERSRGSFAARLRMWWTSHHG